MTRYGTCHFRSVPCALAYYASQGYTRNHPHNLNP